MNSYQSLDSEAKNLNRLYMIASAIITVAVAIAGSVAFAISFDPYSRYFESSLISTAFLVALATSAIFALSAFIIFKGEEAQLKRGLAPMILSGVAALGSTLSFIYYIYGDITARVAAQNATSGSSAALYNGPDTLTVGLIITGISATVYSLAKAFSKNKAFTLLLGYCRVLFFALVITAFYLDFAVELNSPVKLFIQFSAGAAMLSTVSDLRVVVGKSHAPSFVLSKLLTVILATLGAGMIAFEVIPNIAKYGQDYVLYPVILLLCAIECGYELFTFTAVLPANENDDQPVAKTNVDTKTETDPDVNPEIAAEVEITEPKSESESESSNP